MPILRVMDDFRSQLTEVLDATIDAGVEPMFLVVELVGAEEIKRLKDVASLDTFREAAMASVINATHTGDAFSYGEYRIVGILPGFDRLKTFALIDKLGRALPLLAQSFDCYLQPEFDTLDYDPKLGVAGLINQLVARPKGPQRDVA